MARLPLAACALAAALASSLGGREATAQPRPSFAYDRQLGIAAGAALRRALSPEARGPLGPVRRVYVRCYRSRRAFEEAFERRFGAPARRVVGYYVRGPDIHLRRGTCANVRAFLGGRVTVLTAGAFAVLLHEALHRQGLLHERLTTCFANEAVRWGALWAGFREEQALRARNLAFAYARRYTHPSYFIGRPTCLALARRANWTAFIARRP